MSKNTGGGQGDFDNVQIEADFFPGRLPLGRKINEEGMSRLKQLGMQYYRGTLPPLVLCVCSDSTDGGSLQDSRAESCATSQVA